MPTPRPTAGCQHRGHRGWLAHWTRWRPRRQLGTAGTISAVGAVRAHVTIRRLVALAIVGVATAIVINNWSTWRRWRRRARVAVPAPGVPAGLLTVVVRAIKIALAARIAGRRDAASAAPRVVERVARGLCARDEEADESSSGSLHFVLMCVELLGHGTASAPQPGTTRASSHVRGLPAALWCPLSTQTIA